MKKEIWLLWILLPLFNSCSEFGSKKFNLELIDDNPYILKINNFDWHDENGRAVGDFGSLDTAILKLLNKKHGICEIYIQNNSNSNGTKSDYEYLGFVNILYRNDGITLETNDGPGEIHYMIEKHFNNRRLTKEKRISDSVKTESDNAKKTNSNSNVDTIYKDKTKYIDTLKKI